MVAASAMRLISAFMCINYTFLINKFIIINPHLWVRILSLRFIKIGLHNKKNGAAEATPLLYYLCFIICVLLFVLYVRRHSRITKSSLSICSQLGHLFLELSNLLIRFTLGF